MNVEVRRASHVHQIPHAGLPQSTPVISPTVQQTTPTSTAETPSQSHFGLARDEPGDVGDERDDRTR